MTASGVDVPAVRPATRAPANHSGRRSVAFAPGTRVRSAGCRSRRARGCCCSGRRRPPRPRRTSRRARRRPPGGLVGTQTVVSTTRTSDSGNRQRISQASRRTRSIGCVVCATTPNRRRGCSRATSSSSDDVERVEVLGHPRTSTWFGGRRSPGGSRRLRAPSRSGVPPGRWGRWHRGRAARSRTAARRRSDAPCAVMATLGVSTSVTSCRSRMPRAAS